MENQFNTLPRIQYAYHFLFCKMECSTVSKAFFRSRNSQITIVPTSKDVVMLFNSVIVVWNVSDENKIDIMYHIINKISYIYFYIIFSNIFEKKANIDIGLVLLLTNRSSPDLISGITGANFNSSGT